MKTEQQLRFENVLATHLPAWKPGFDVDDDGSYLSVAIADIWQGFQLGEASSLERAAKVCELLSDHHYDNYRTNGGSYDEGRADSAGECADAIRALAQEVGNE